MESQQQDKDNSLLERDTANDFSSSPLAGASDDAGDDDQSDDETDDAAADDEMDEDL